MAKPRISTGTIIWFDVNKACGFAKPDDGGPDIFARLLSSRAIPTKEFAPGQDVKFELIGRKAVIVS